MRVRSAEQVFAIPGTNQVVKRQIREWQCPECDYFEEIEPGEVEPE